MLNKEQIRLEWKERVDQFKQSNLSMKKWCAENGFKICQLQYWLNKYKNDNNNHTTPNKWISLDLYNNALSKTNSNQNNESVIVSHLNIKVGSFTIEVEPGFDSNLLKDVVKVLSVL